MAEYNFWLNIKFENSAKCTEIKSKLETDEPYPNISQPGIIEATSDEIYLLWDVSVVNESEEDDYDIATLLNFLFKDGVKKAYGLYQSEYDESNSGNFIFVDNNSEINPDIFEITDFMIFSGEEEGESIFEEYGIPGFDSDDEDEYILDIDVDNIVLCFRCIVEAHESDKL